MPVPQFEVHQKMAILFGMFGHRRPTRNLRRRFSPAVFKAETKLSGERVAARFACGAESLAVYRAVYKCIASRCRRGATTSYEGKISIATCTSDYVNLLACWSRYFPESVPDGYIGVGYSLFYYYFTRDKIKYEKIHGNNYTC